MSRPLAVHMDWDIQLRVEYALLALILQAVEVYQRLAALLAGEAPRGLLPPAPRGYAALRIRQLAGTHRQNVSSTPTLQYSCNVSLPSAARAPRLCRPPHPPADR